MDLCRICLLPGGGEGFSLEFIFGQWTIAEMIKFCSGIEVKIKFSKMVETYVGS